MTAPAAAVGPAAAAGKLGFWMTVALVVGNIIGSGVYLVPASLAPYGRNSLRACLFTATGALVLAVVFAALARAAIRGVDSTGSLKTLLEKNLIKIIGHKKAPGNPLVYRPSDRFLQYFGLNSLDDLPKEEEIAKLLQEDKSGEA